MKGGGYSLAQFTNLAQELDLSVHSSHTLGQPVPIHFPPRLLLEETYHVRQFLDQVVHFTLTVLERVVEEKTGAAGKLHEQLAAFGGIVAYHIGPEYDIGTGQCVYGKGPGQTSVW